MTGRHAVEVHNSYAEQEIEVDSDGAEEQQNILTEAIQKGIEEVSPDSRRRKKKNMDDGRDFKNDGREETVKRPRRISIYD